MFPLTHWGRVTHICISKLTIIGSDNFLSPDQRQAIIWTNAGILLIEPLGTNFSEILIEILTFSFTKMHLEVLSAKWRPFCLGLNVLNNTEPEIGINKTLIWHFIITSMSMLHRCGFLLSGLCLIWENKCLLLTLARSAKTWFFLLNYCWTKSKLIAFLLSPFMGMYYILWCDLLLGTLFILQNIYLSISKLP